MDQISYRPQYGGYGKPPYGAVASVGRLSIAAGPAIARDQDAGKPDQGQELDVGLAQGGQAGEYAERQRETVGPGRAFVG